MRVLFLSFYYEPDLSAGSFRSVALTRALQEQLPAASTIDVLTTMPNRYKSFTVDVSDFEQVKGLSIHRISLPAHHSGMRDQSRAFLAYARGVQAYARNRKYDMVFATSSRLMTAALGAYVARRQKIPLHLDIRDIFVETIRDIVPHWSSWVMCSLFSFVERYAVAYASKVNLVSGGFENYFKQHYPRQHFTFYPNGIDDEFMNFTPINGIRNESNPPFSILYAGNLGEGQGLHAILPSLAGAMRGKVVFTVIGDGGRKALLREVLEDAGVDNVVLQDPINRTALLEAYQKADVLFLHLNDYAAFRKVLPSKIFEYAASGKPIWAGVAGYAAKFIEKEIKNAAVFPPCDVEAAVDVFNTLRMENTPRTDFVQKYERRKIMKSLAEDLVSVGVGGLR